MANHKNKNKNQNRRSNDNPSGKKATHPAPQPLSASEANEMPPPVSLPNDEEVPLIPFKTKMWLIFGVGISLIAIVAAAIFDLSFGVGFEKIRDSRFPDFILATLAISASVINIIIDLNAEIDKKINYAIFLYYLQVAS